MMPYDTYRLYQIERAKGPAEIQRSDEQAAQLASAVSSLLRGITRSARAGRRLCLAWSGVAAKLPDTCRESPWLTTRS